MAYIKNPLLSEELQKEQDIEIYVTDESGETINIVEMVSKLQTQINNKLAITFGADEANKLVITDGNGKITTIVGVVMTSAEREKLQRLTNTMIFKGVKSSIAEIEAVENPENGWVFFLQSGDTFLQYCYCSPNWEMIGTTATQMTYQSNKGGVVKSVGGIPVGTVIYGKTYDEIFTDMFFPYIAPSGFSISPSGSPSNLTSVLEVGTVVTIDGVTPKVSVGTKPITSFKVYKDSAHTEELGSSETVQKVTFDSVTQSSIYATITDGTMDTPLSASWTATFVNPYFYGIMDSKGLPTSAQVQALTKQLVTKGDKTYKFTASDQYCAIAFPSTYGSLKSILDSNGYEYLGDFQKYSLDVDFGYRTVNYNVYVQQKAATVTSFAFTFKF